MTESRQASDTVEPGGVELRADLARIVFQNSAALFPTTFFIAITTFSFLYPYVDSDLLARWAVLLGIIMIIRAAFGVFYFYQRPHDESMSLWAYGYAALTLVTSLCWALLPAWFLPTQQPLVFMGIATPLVGMAAGALALYMYLPSIYLAFTAPLMLTLTYTAFLQQPPYRPLAWLFLIAYATFLTLMTMGYRRSREGVKSQLRSRDMAQKLLEEKQRVEDASRAKSQFLAAVSHDLRQPLQSVRLYLDLIQQKTTSPDLLAIQGKAERSMLALEDMFNQLLDMSRIDAQSVEARLEAVDLGELAARVQAQFEPQAQQKGIELWNETEHVWAWADPVLLKRILDNFVSNAIRYTEQGSVSIGCRWLDGVVELDVMDSGPGIPRAERERIFDDFYQLHNAPRQRAQGLGIGLAIVRRLCDLMGIDLEVESWEGLGTRMKLYLCAVYAMGADKDDTVPVSHSLPPGTPTLLVEDDEQVRAAILRTLSEAGASITCYPSADEALTHTDPSNPPALIITDIRLTGETTGHELVRRLRERASGS